MKREKKMNRFIRENFNFHGGYLTYQEDINVRSQFVARFKYTPADRGRFITFLIRNFTVSEYFSALDAGEAPAHILQSKGYVSSTIRRLLKRTDLSDEVKTSLESTFPEGVKFA
jgi:hypothetical protein